MSVALVTGAASGIGQATADHLESQGWEVARNDLPGRTVDGYAAAFDVTDPDAVSRGVERVASERGPVTVLFANAGVTELGSLDDMPEEQFWRVVRINLCGVFYCAQACARYMREAKWGRIISTSSQWGLTGAADATAYSASKAGIISLTKSLARTLGPHGITVNTIAPGPIDTPMLVGEARDRGVSVEELYADKAATNLLGRVGSPQDIAALVGYIASPTADSLTGQVLSCDGGATRR